VGLYCAPGGFGVRVDSHLYGGYHVPPQYDSMLAKIIARGPDRNSAIRRMDTALSGFILRGMPTTAGYQRAIMRDPIFQRGSYTTKFAEEFAARTAPDKIFGENEG
jgi:acetyl-CoA carboxylase biotin carboxylase subunit